MDHIKKPKSMKCQALHIEIRNWIQSVIMQRKALIRIGKSRADAYLMNQTMEYLNRHLGYYPFNDDSKMAGFFLRNQDKIHFILPGTGSASYESRMKQFRNYLGLTKNITEHENLHQRENYRRRLCSSISEI